jgi:ubiquinone biosynthesis UbiH/UbiF/VisC/COQ6 family hydroxylase
VKTDILIIGGGPSGLSFARSLADTELEILVVEKSPRDQLQAPAMDGREIALTHLSIETLRNLGAWPRIPAEEISPIREARVLDGDSPYSLDFDQANLTVDALGYLVSNHLIRKALFEEVEASTNVVLAAGVTVNQLSTNPNGATAVLSNGKHVEASLVVAADSRFSEARRKMGIPADMHDFSRVAIVCRMEHDQPHHDTAFECFHYQRTLAVLPMSGGLSSIVITAPTHAADEIMSMSEQAFNKDVMRRFQNKLGQMALLGERYAYPLVAVYAERFSARRFALIGDAAVGMHPVTAHGFNLGLRGQATLARGIRKALASGVDIADPIVLEAYHSEHRRVTRPLYLATNALVDLFTNDTPPGKLLRKLVLRLGNGFPPLKRLIAEGLTETNARWSAPLTSLLPRS